MTESRNQTSGSSSTVDQIRDYDWNTTDSNRFLNQFGTIVGRAKQAGVSEQQLLDTISQRYHSGQSGSSSGGTTGGSSSNR
jgi:hypothetical protein